MTRPHIVQPSDPAVRHIALTKGQVAIVDTEDYERLSQSLWASSWNAVTGSFYATTTKTLVGGGYKVVSMQREVLRYLGSDVVDHIDGATLDNRKANLRVATKSQNGMNAKLSKANTSGLKGAAWSKGMKKWMAQIQFNHVHKLIGYYATAEEAHAAYMNEATIQAGEFARAA